MFSAKSVELAARMDLAALQLKSAKCRRTTGDLGAAFLRFKFRANSGRG